MGKIANDKYYTENSIAKYCVEKTFEILGADWDRIIELGHIWLICQITH